MRRAPQLTSAARRAAEELAHVAADHLAHQCTATSPRLREAVDAYFEARGTTTRRARSTRFWANVERLSSRGELP